MYFCRSKLAFVQFHNFLDIFRGGLIAMPPHHSVFKPFFCIVIYRLPSQELPVFTSATTQCIYLYDALQCCEDDNVQHLNNSRQPAGVQTIWMKKPISN